MNYDFEARHYDPRIGRWAGVDLLAETYENVSPYNYVANSPINNIDPNGMDFSQGIPCPKWGEPGGGLFSAGANVLASFAAGLLGRVGNGPVALDKANAPGQQASFQSRSNITSSLNEDGTTVQEGGGDPGGKKKTNANQGGDCCKTGNDQSTLGHNIFYSNYIGPWNPKDNNGNWTYKPFPLSLLDAYARDHDRAYDKARVAGFSGVVFSTKTIGADYTLVGNAFDITFNPY